VSALLSLPVEENVVSFSLYASDQLSDKVLGVGWLGRWERPFVSDGEGLLLFNGLFLYFGFRIPTLEKYIY
jgi:hypothetical protein